MNTEQIQPADLIYSLRLSVSHASGIHRNTINGQFCLLLSLISLDIGLLYMFGFDNPQVLFSLVMSGTTAALGLLSNMRAKQIFDQMVQTDLKLPES